MADKTVLSTIHAAIQGIKQGANKIDIVNEAPADADAQFPVRILAYRVGSLLRVDIQGYLDK